MAHDPNRPIRLIVPGSKGGPGNIIAATLASELSKLRSQRIDIEPAKSQPEGLAATASAPADGHTLCMGGGSFYISAALYRSLPFDPFKDFAPVNLVASIANVLVVHPSLPIHSIADFIAYAKANPGRLRYGSSGYGSPPHIAGASFCQFAGIDLAHVPYKGHVVAGHALTEGKELDLMFDAVPTATPHLDAGELRGLGVTTTRRLAALPNMPAIAEVLPGYELNPAMGILAPAGTPEALLAELGTQIGQVMAMASIRAKLEGIGIEAISSTREHFASYMGGQFVKWSKALKDAGIEPLDAPGSA